MCYKMGQMDQSWVKLGQSWVTLEAKSGQNWPKLAQNPKLDRNTFFDHRDTPFWFKA